MDRLSELRRQVIADPAFENVAALYHHYLRLGEKDTPLENWLRLSDLSREAVAYISENVAPEIDADCYQILDFTNAHWVRYKKNIYYYPHNYLTLEIFVNDWIGDCFSEFATEKAFELGLRDFAEEEHYYDKAWTVDGYLITNVPHEYELCIFDTKKKIDVDSWHKEFIKTYIEQE